MALRASRRRTTLPFFTHALTQILNVPWGENTTCSENMRFFRWRLVLDLVFGFTGRALKSGEEEPGMDDAEEAAQVALLESLAISRAVPSPMGGSPPAGPEPEMPDGVPIPWEETVMVDAEAAAEAALPPSMNSDQQPPPAAAHLCVGGSPPRDPGRIRLTPDAGLSPKPSPGKAPRRPTADDKIS